MNGAHDVVEAVCLGQRYGRRWVFRSLDVQVKPGVTALLGPNGAGKTTFLHSVVGLRRPAAGALRVLGVDVLRRGGIRAVAARLGFLPQTAGFYPRYTVWDYVAYAAWLKGVRSRDLPPLVAEALERLALTPHASTRMAALSGGMQRRAGIAQALVAGPKLLVLDEPVAGLDPEQRIELRRLIRTLAETGSVLLSTHTVEDVRHVADRVLVLHNGGVVFDGTVEQLQNKRLQNRQLRNEQSDIDGDTDLERGYMTVVSRPTDGSVG